MRLADWYAVAVALVASSAAAGVDCTEQLIGARRDAQLACLRTVQASGPAGSAATKNVCALLAHSDGSTDDVVIASALDVLRSAGPKAAPAAETLSALLPHRSALYRGRDKFQVVRLRAYIVVTLSEIGFPRSAMPALLDTLGNLDERMSPVEVASAARAVASLGSAGRELEPYLLEALLLRVSPEELSLGRYEQEFPPEEATTVQLEVVRALARISSPGDRDVVDRLREVAALRGSGLFDPRLPQEATRALAIIEGGSE